MYCAKCGKEIDNDSTFCPFCGQKVGAPVENTNFGNIVGSFGKKGIQKMSVLPKFAGNKKVYGFFLAFVAVVIVISGVVKLSGGKKSALEKLYEMSWKETSKFSLDDFMALLDKEGIRYIKNSRSTRYNVGYDEDLFITLYNDTVYVKEFEPFFGGDCIAYYDTYEFESVYIICYKTLDEFEKGMEAFEKDMREKCMVCEKLDFEEHSRHLVELTKENVDICIENAVEHVAHMSISVSGRTIEEYEGNVRNKYSDSDISVCRIVRVSDSGKIDSDFLQSKLWYEEREVYSREMFEPYSYFCRIVVEHDLKEESEVKKSLEEL